MARCKCHENYDDGNDWWRCPVHDRVTKSEYEDEYETEPPKGEKKPRPAPAKKAAPVKKAAATKKARPAAEVVDEDDGDDGDDGDGKAPTNEPPDKEPKPDPEGGDGEKPKGPSHGMSRRFWG